MSIYRTSELVDLLNSNEFQQNIGTARFWSHHKATELPVVHALKKPADSKPWGSVWWGVGGDWISWLHSESPDWMESRFSVVSALYVENRRILSIQTDEQLQVFSFKYSHPTRIHKKGDTISWKLLQDQGFSGIEIPNYLRHSRMNLDTFWYYGWDCASGAVWDQAAILGHRPLFVYRRYSRLWYPI